MLVMLPVAYPIAKLLDFFLGHESGAYFRRNELSALVGFHKEEATGTVHGFSIVFFHRIFLLSPI